MTHPKPTISLWFSDILLDTPDKRTVLERPIEIRLLLDFLQAHFNIVLDAENPQWVLYNIFGHRKCRYLGMRMFASGENFSPYREHCDSSACYDASDPHSIFLPLWALRDLSPLLSARPIPTKHKFCAFVYKRSTDTRNALWEGLARHFRIDALGLLGQNTHAPTLQERFAPDWFESLVDSYTPYKFVIAAENSRYAGYLTEKLFAAFLARAVPIYWGDPQVTRYINPKAFISASQFKTHSALARHMQEIANDTARYQAYLDAPVFCNNTLPAIADWQQIANQFRRLLQTTKQASVAQRYMLSRELASRLPAPILDELLQDPIAGGNRYPHLLPYSPRRPGGYQLKP